MPPKPGTSVLGADHRLAQHRRDRGRRHGGARRRRRRGPASTPSFAAGRARRTPQRAERRACGRAGARRLRRGPAAASGRGPAADRGPSGSRGAAPAALLLGAIRSTSAAASASTSSGCWASRRASAAATVPPAASSASASAARSTRCSSGARRGRWLGADARSLCGARCERRAWSRRRRRWSAALAMTGGWTESELCARARGRGHDAAGRGAAAARARGAVVRGSIDLLAETPGAAPLVIDYKTDRLGEGTPAERAARYGIQRDALRGRRRGGDGGRPSPRRLRLPRAPRGSRP